VTEQDATWRVYLREWVIVYPGSPGKAECARHFESRYAGRVRDQDWRIVPGAGGYRLELRLPNLKGEYRDRADALEHYTELPHAYLVQAGTPEEKALLGYGRKMLPEGGAGS
jgi:hypothetical protein